MGRHVEGVLLTMPLRCLPGFDSSQGRTAVQSLEMTYAYGRSDLRLCVGPFERVFHWGLVAGFTLSYFTQQAEQ